ncbi:Stk1 family PASTA domain-containing Ser/Thr kinase [Rhodococcus hoagii]|jgi:serine/threonine-protein kinase|uniref:non-specific serine/threonine protein kinase n=3 Tax=Rhodococcus hoagii TaxID=43767 RepID=E9T839_RHOHA|nr:Stk1 family PASTA domain-containing Ser/Thr kinase [Prescottella equi]MBU4615813.1 Stk1 family PASTA domain-containing Ser/Thr kinase [Rhodococcus sp. GG48]MCD7052882.1 Stk1 family PASTA domain-containing Ser/Thr kinase [Rhodococcus sp. BH2-1]GBF16542.1 serine/threonine-protein kinase PknB [Rhodococcus sp. Br-6]AVP66494.1 Stk1 family PASTA domain-containing Ser/Thr kinase [Prescottella equi]EGD21443.1 kinase domain protein [Prescottella equi ATCC 33707]
MTTPRNLSSRYELGEILGFGGMSEVHLGRDLRLSRDVAIKVLRADLARDPTFYLRFRREAQNAAALNHPAIVAVYDTGEAETDAGPLPYIVMEYVDGDTLRDIIRTEGPLQPRRAMEVIADVCAALDFSHRNGIVHRDMKPANIMINRAGAVKVMDFGIARAISDSSSPMTQTAAVIGTAQYLSPEQARGEQVDARSDVYSLGCVLYEVLTGEPPFKGDSPVAVAYQHVREDPKQPSQVNPAVPPALDSVILKAMSKNPANRYQSAAEMRSDLVRVLGGQRPSAPMVMSDEDRTTMFGPVDSGAGTGSGYRPEPARTSTATAAPVAVPAAAPAKKSNTARNTMLSVAALVVVGIIGAFIWSLVSNPAKVEVPNVAGLTAQAAEAQLRGMNLDTSIQTRPDAVVAEGNVIATTPSAGSSVSEKSTVTLQVSSGPEQVQVPKLAGLSQDEAAQALNAVGLRLAPEVDRAPSDPAQLDKVTAQDPSSGAKINLDSTVSITLGSGPEQVRIPNVIGQTIDVAQPNIEGVGFKVQVATVDSSKPEGQVISTSPSGGSTAAKGDVITVQVSNGKQFTMPDLTEMSVSQAVEALRKAGWTGSSNQLTQTRQSTLDASLVGKILGQQQPAGSDVAKNAPLTVIVGELGIPR